MRRVLPRLALGLIGGLGPLLLNQRPLQAAEEASPCATPVLEATALKCLAAPSAVRLAAKRGSAASGAEHARRQPA